MRVSETVDSRVRRAFLRIAASQVSSILVFHFHLAVYVCEIIWQLLDLYDPIDLNFGLPGQVLTLQNGVSTVLMY